MLRTLTILIVCLLSYGPAFSADPAKDSIAPYQLDWIDTPTFRYRTAVNASELLIIDTTTPLTVDKLTEKGAPTMVRSLVDAKLLSPAGKDTLERLLKINEIQSVLVAYRRIEIMKFPYKTSWETIVPEILKVLNVTLKP